MNKLERRIWRERLRKKDTSGASRMVHAYHVTTKDNWSWKKLSLVAYLLRTLQWNILLQLDTLLTFSVVGPYPQRDRDYHHIRSNFWKFYFIKTDELVFLVKVSNFWKFYLIKTAMNWCFWWKRLDSFNWTLSIGMDFFFGCWGLWIQ